QRRVGKKLVPPRQQPSAGLSQRIIPAQRNAIHAVVGPLKPIRQIGRQVVRGCHVPRLSKPAVRRQANLFFPSAVWEKACIAILENLRETRKFFASKNSRIRTFLAPRRQVRKSFFTLRLCVFAGNVPIPFGCGFAALGSLRSTLPCPSVPFIP